MGKKKELPKRYRRQKRYKAFLILILILVLPLCAFMIYRNIVDIQNVDSGAGTTLELVTEAGDGTYTIGNNPTEVDHTYFTELASAVESGDQSAIAQAVVKDFVAEYCTWTNKDSNYDLGGMQYIYSDLRSSFEDYSRCNFYSELFLFINQYGRENLIQVKEVTISDVQTTEYTLTVEEDVESEDGSEPETVYNEVTMSGYLVTADWTYEDNSTLDTSSFMNHGVFTVVDHDGRMEIISISGEGA